MITEYVHAALSRAKYELLPDAEGFYVRVPELPGVWANADSLEQCRRELMEVVHRGDIRKELLGRLLKQATMTRQDWEQL